MRLLAFQLDTKTAIAIAVASLLTIGACAEAQPAAKDAECAAVRTFYAHAQTELINKGACDDAKSVSTCAPHIALREAFIASLKETKCPSEGN